MAKVVVCQRVKELMSNGLFLVGMMLCLVPSIIHLHHMVQNIGGDLRQYKNAVGLLLITNRIILLSSCGEEEAHETFHTATRT